MSSGSASVRLARSVSALGDEVDGLSHGRDRLRLLVADLDAEALLEIHDQLDEVERIGLEVVAEVRAHVDVILLDVEALDENLADLFEDLFATGQTTLPYRPFAGIEPGECSRSRPRRTSPSGTPPDPSRRPLRRRSRTPPPWPPRDRREPPRDRTRRGARPRLPSGTRSRSRRARRSRA